MMNRFTTSEKEQNRTIDRYYRFQSRIYDSTRWSFLFGRKEIIRQLPPLPEPIVVEIGCGTGYNIKRLVKHYPDGAFYGIDLSADMITRAEKNLRHHRNKVRLLQAPYQEGHSLFPKPVDVILFSYSLTMINPQWKMLINQALADLKDDGFLAVVDFHDSRFDWFKSHMGNHHVRMDGHLLSYLEEVSDIKKFNKGRAYGGIWEYMWCVAQKCS